MRFQVDVDNSNQWFFAIYRREKVSVLLPRSTRQVTCDIDTVGITTAVTSVQTISWNMLLKQVRQSWEQFEYFLIDVYAVERETKAIQLKKQYVLPHSLFNVSLFYSTFFVFCLTRPYGQPSKWKLWIANQNVQSKQVRIMWFLFHFDFDE